jgi:hypothetical protein
LYVLWSAGETAKRRDTLAAVSLQRKVDALADQTTTLAEEAVQGGERDLAIELFRWGEVLRQWAAGKRALTAREPSANLQPVTGAQLTRRGKAIAKGHAAKSGDLLWKAITDSKWGSQEIYARKRLGVSPGSLSAYRSGATPCPRPVAAKVLADFGIGDEYWRGGVVD